MTAIDRIHMVHLMNADWAPGGHANYQTKPVDLACESAGNLLPPTTTITIIIIIFLIIIIVIITHPESW